MVNTVNSKRSYLDILLILLLVIVFFNIINISKYCLLILLIYSLYQLINRKLAAMVFNDVQFWCLVAFSFTYTAIQLCYGFIDVRTATVYLLYFIVFYVFGMIIVSNICFEGQVAYYMYAVIIGLSLFGVVAVIYTNYHGMQDDLPVRAATIPWIKGSQISATVIGTYVSLGIALLGLIFVRTNVLKKVLNGSIALLSLYASISLANRTGLLIGALSAVLVWIMQTRFNSISDNIVLTGSSIFSGLMFLLLFNMNLLNIKMFWLQSNAYARFVNKDISKDPRIIAWIEALQGLFTHPLGGKQAKLGLMYAHNLWLDVGYSAGLLAFIVLIIFTVMTLVCYVKLLHNNNISRYSKCLITAMMCAFFVTFMVEPVIEANYLFFGAFCLFSGILRAIDVTIKPDNNRKGLGKGV